MKEKERIGVGVLGEVEVWIGFTVREGKMRLVVNGNGSEREY